MGREAAGRVEEARQFVAEVIGAPVDRIFFTGSGSESNNMVLKQLLFTSGVPGPVPSGERIEFITSAIEHPSIMETSKFLAKRGVPVHFIPVDENGQVSINKLKERLSDRTALVSIMTANNEIGTIEDISAITKLVHEAGALMHTDAVQAVGKIPVDVEDLGVDYLSYSGHKLNGPKGVGALYIRERVPAIPLIHGGHQERGLRAGTYNTLGIIGMGKAAEIILRDGEKERVKLKKLREMLKKGIQESIPDIIINSGQDRCLPGTLNISFKGAEGESILLYLDLEGIMVSTGSACASGSLDPSHVLLAIGVNPELAHGSIRFSLGLGSSEEDVDYVLEKLPGIMSKIRKMSTLY
jgi:cysteine desulfurase